MSATIWFVWGAAGSPLLLCNIIIAIFATNSVIKPSDLYWAIGISLILICLGPILYGVAVVWTLVTVYMSAIHPRILSINNEPLLMQNGNGQWMVVEKEKPKQIKAKGRRP